MFDRRGIAFSAWVALASFLLFALELIQARRLLPLFGSSAAVWTTALMFYQGALFLGYLWAAWASRRVARGGYRLTHVVLMALAALAFPLRLWRPEMAPIPAVVLSLTVGVGLPFIALSTTSVIAQSWWRLTGHPRAADPWFLYGASNAGALAALVAYPLLIEPNLGLSSQLKLWYGGYGAFLLLQILCVRALRPAPSEAVSDDGVAARPGGRSIAMWVGFSAGGSALLMAITNVVTVDAPIPLMWAIPLGVYLLTLVWTFGPQAPSEQAVNRAGMAAVFLSVVALGALITGAAFQAALVALGNLILFVGALRAHHALVGVRPSAPSQLGVFYLAVSLGGWLGSLLIAVAVPLMASSIPTFGVDCLVAGGVLLGAFVLRDAEAARALLRRRWPVFTAGALAVGAIALAVSVEASGVHGARTFYGVYRVQDDGPLRRFVHGNTVHGYQNRAQGRAGEPLAYYHRLSPVGRALGRLGPEISSVGIVGLGVGVLTAYGLPHQRWDLFELDPEVASIAQTHFTYLDDSPAAYALMTGDGRLNLAQDSHTYDILVIDTFSSDFVPTHLLTREALDIYLGRLSPRGLLFFHITNRIFDLAPVLAAHCKERQLSCAVAEAQGLTQGDLDAGRLATRWFVMTSDAERYDLLVRGQGWQGGMEGDGRRVWTDDRSDLLGAVR